MAATQSCTFYKNKLSNDNEAKIAKKKNKLRIFGTFENEKFK